MASAVGPDQPAQPSPQMTSPLLNRTDKMATTACMGGEYTGPQCTSHGAVVGRRQSEKTSRELSGEDGEKKNERAIWRASAEGEALITVLFRDVPHFIEYPRRRATPPHIKSN